MPITIADLRAAAQSVKERPNQPGCFSIDPPVEVTDALVENASLVMHADAFNEINSTVHIRNWRHWRPVKEFEIKTPPLKALRAPKE